MEFLKKDCDKLVKYDVQFDVEKLELVRKEIIKKCGIRQHYEYQTDYPEHLSVDRLLIENYTDSKVGQKEYFEEMRTIYSVSFDKIEEPELAQYINAFIKNEDQKLLECIYNYNLLPNNYANYLNKSNEQRNILINDIKDALDASDMAINYDEIKEKVDELKNIDANLKKNQTLNLTYQEDYKDAVRAAFKMKLIGTIPYDEYERVMKFIPKK